MKPKKYNLPNFTDKQLNRLEEVKFYIFTTRILKLCKNKLKQYSIGDVANILAELTNTNPIDIQNAIVLITKQNAMPSKKETAILLKYLDIPYRDINESYMSTRTFYSLIEEYSYLSETEQLNYLVPRLDETTNKEIKQFNTNFEKEVFPVIRILTIKKSELERNEDITYADDGD